MFVLAVNLRFTAPEDKQAFLEVWAPLAEFVRVHEPATLSFELLQSDKDDCHVLVYERSVQMLARWQLHARVCMCTRSHARACIAICACHACACRYLDRAAYLAHRESGAFKHFKAMQAALPFKVAVAGDSFHEQNLGFML